MVEKLLDFDQMVEIKYKKGVNMKRKPSFKINLQLIKDCMKKKNLSRKKLAERANISISTINNIFAGHTNIRMSRWIRLVQVLEIKPDDLILPLS